jgi:hypothetical protein
LHYDAGTRRGLRDSLAGKVALLLAVLFVAFIVARTCGSSSPDVSQEEAIEIAEEEIDFEPSQVQIRNVPRGIEGQRSWMVSLYTGTAINPDQCRLVEVEADSGDVLGVVEC